MHPDRTLFPFLPDLPSNPCTTLQKQITSPVCVTHILTGIWLNSQWPAPLKKMECFPCPRSHQLWRTSLQHLYHCFKRLYSIPSCSDCFFCGGGGRRGSCLRSLKRLLSYESAAIAIDNTAKDASLPTATRGSWGHRHQSSVMDIHMASGCSRDLRYHNVASRGSRNHR